MAIHDSKLKAGRKTKQVAGDRFGRWTLVTRIGTVNSRPSWLCACDCGVTKEMRIENLRRGHSESCGCLQSEIASKQMRTHGRSRTVEHRTWANMLNRCNSPTSKSFLNYGARGIRVCERWDSFENFYADLGPRPSSAHSIDRIDNNGDYSPENCRWVTNEAQIRNTRRTRLNEVAVRVLRYLSAHGVSSSRLRAAYGIKGTTLRHVIANRTWNFAGN